MYYTFVLHAGRYDFHCTEVQWGKWNCRNATGYSAQGLGSATTETDHLTDKSK